MFTNNCATIAVNTNLRLYMQQRRVRDMAADSCRHKAKKSFLCICYHAACHTASNTNRLMLHNYWFTNRPYSKASRTARSQCNCKLASLNLQTASVVWMQQHAARLLLFAVCSECIYRHMHVPYGNNCRCSRNPNPTLLCTHHNFVNHGPGPC